MVQHRMYEVRHTGPQPEPVSPEAVRTQQEIYLNMAGNQRRRQGRRTSRRRKPDGMLFTQRNYQLLLLGVALIIAGYVVMRVDNQVDGFLSLYVAPLIILGGYLEIIYAILWRPKATGTE